MANKGRLSVECIKAVLFFTETRTVVVTQRPTSVHFQMRWAPSFKTIHKLYNQFNNDGSVLERKHRWPSSVRSPENTDAVRVALQRSSSKSTRKAAAQLGISRCSVQQILKNLNLYPLKKKSLLHIIQTGSGVHPTSYKMGTGGSFLGVKRQGREADHSPPISAEVKKMRISIFPPPYTSSWCNA
jgi:hypothetical protein